MERDPKLEISLLAIRLATVAFLLVWVADKFVNPKHSQAVLGSFYAMKDASPQIVLGLGVAAVAARTGLCRRMEPALDLRRRAGDAWGDDDSEPMEDHPSVRTICQHSVLGRRAGTGRTVRIVHAARSRSVVFHRSMSRWC